MSLGVAVNLQASLLKLACRYTSHMLHVLTKEDGRDLSSIDVSAEVLRHSRRKPGEAGGIVDNYLTRFAAGWSVLGRPTKAGVWGVRGVPQLTWHHFQRAMHNLERMQVGVTPGVGVPWWCGGTADLASTGMHRTTSRLSGRRCGWPMPAHVHAAPTSLLLLRRWCWCWRRLVVRRRCCGPWACRPTPRRRGPEPTSPRPACLASCRTVPSATWNASMSGISCCTHGPDNGTAAP